MSPTEPAPARVLVVEDRPDQARMIAGLLEAGGLMAEIAPSGEEAIEAMGLFNTQRLATILDGITRHSPEGINFKTRSETVGWKQAVDERDRAPMTGPRTGPSTRPSNGSHRTQKGNEEP